MSHIPLLSRSLSPRLAFWGIIIPLPHAHCHASIYFHYPPSTPLSLSFIPCSSLPVLKSIYETMITVKLNHTQDYLTGLVMKKKN